MKRGSWFLLVLAVTALAGCNSIDPTFGLRGNSSAADKPAADTAGQSAEIASAPAAAPAPPAASPQIAALTKNVRLNFAPIVGAPVTAVTPLSRRLSADAAVYGITITAANEVATTHVMKGYFSTLSEGGQTTVIYVWDILDRSGNRLHRIQGQEKAAGSADDPWSVVPPSTMEAIADRTMQEFTAWLQANAS